MLRLRNSSEYRAEKQCRARFYWDSKDAGRRCVVPGCHEENSELFICYS